jgi:hypothetical protein
LFSANGLYVQLAATTKMLPASTRIFSVCLQ